MKLDFEAFEWKHKAREMAGSAGKLRDLIWTEQHLVGLVERYNDKEFPYATVCTHARVDEDGNCRLISEVKLDNKAEWLPVVISALQRQIADVRQQIEKLFGELVG